MNLDAGRRRMRDEGIDAWVVYDFRNSILVLPRILGQSKWTTRRVFVVIAQRGEPVLLCHEIDVPALRDLKGVERRTYLTWQQMIESLRTLLQGAKTVAMEYSPNCALPVVSIADAGTVELVRSLGPKVVSSADLVQVALAGWTDSQFASHEHASKCVADIKDEAFDLIRTSARSKPVSEHHVQQFILTRFRAAGLETAEAPIVAVGPHAGDPHYEISESGSSLITPGDWVLIDLWARSPGEHNIFADITWVGFVGDTPSVDHERVFNAVKRARDAAISLAQKRWNAGQAVAGYELDDASMAELRAADLDPYIRHRTGHSLSAGPAVHGIGMNLDNLETHDVRTMLPRIGFTVEPGAYLPEFGVRLEINAWCHPDQGPQVTSCVQDEILRLV